MRDISSLVLGPAFSDPLFPSICKFKAPSCPRYSVAPRRERPTFARHSPCCQNGSRYDDHDHGNEPNWHIGHGRSYNLCRRSHGRHEHGRRLQDLRKSQPLSQPREGQTANQCHQMLWNWYTIDACFISSQWRVTSAGIFALSCIGVILLVMSLEFLRRAVKEFDRYLIKQHIAKAEAATTTATTAVRGSISSKNDGSSRDVPVSACAPVPPFRPNIWQQAIRALLHMVQFAVAYFIMLCVLLRSCLLQSSLTFRSQTRHVLQRIHHHLHLHRRLPWFFHLPVGNADSCRQVSSEL
jgi:solute carrier family 31 (copper transporter), member 1